MLFTCVSQLIFINSDGFAMVVYFPLLVIPEGVHVGVDEYNNEGVEKVEQQPGIHHLHVGGLGQAVTHVDKHRSKH